MRLRFACATLATFLVAGSAMAADAIEEVPAAPAAEIAPVFTWTGFYAGLGGGPTWASGDFDVFSEDMNGGLITGFVGYNWQLDNNFVFGIEGDVSYNWDKSDIGPFEVGLETAGSVRARLGYAIDRALIMARQAGRVRRPISMAPRTTTGTRCPVGRSVRASIMLSPTMSSDGSNIATMITAALIFSGWTAISTSMS